jgi:hypothetical protein
MNLNQFVFPLSSAVTRGHLFAVHAAVEFRGPIDVLQILAEVDK